MSERTLWVVIIGIIGALLCCGVLILGGGAAFVLRAPTATTLPLPTEQGRSAPPAPSPEASVTMGATLPSTPTPNAITTSTPVGNGSEPDPAVQATPAAPLADVPPLDPNAPLSDLSAGLAPASRDELAAHPDVPLYRIRARFDPAAREIVGRQLIRWVNREGLPLNEIYLRLYANAPYYIEGNLAVSQLTANGLPVVPLSEVEDTALRIPLATPLAPGAAVELMMDFQLTIPLGGGYGILGEGDGVFSLYNWHPEVAVYEEGGWVLNPTTDQGDPTNTDISNYEVEIAAPSGWTLVSSGLEQLQAGVTTIVAPLTRNLVLVASDQLVEISTTRGDVTINSYYTSGNERGAKVVLDVTADSLEQFDQSFGSYPYAEMDAAQVGLGGGAAGMESTGLILIGDDFYGEVDLMDGYDGEGLEGVEFVSMLDHIVSHEVAHQWWYGVVGNDAYQHPWLDESLTNWSSEYFYEATRGTDASNMVRDMYIALPYYILLLEEEDQVLDQPVSGFDETGYVSIVYGKGSLMYNVLRQEIGDERFFDFLRRYYERFRFERSSVAGWTETLAEVVGQEQADAFVAKWVEGDQVTLEDLPEPGPMGKIFTDPGGMFGP